MNLYPAVAAGAFLLLICFIFSFGVFPLLIRKRQHRTFRRELKHTLSLTLQNVFQQNCEKLEKKPFRNWQRLAKNSLSALNTDFCNELAPCFTVL